MKNKNKFQTIIRAFLVVLILAQTLSLGLQIKESIKAQAINQANAITTSAVSNFSGIDNDKIFATAFHPIGKRVLIGGKLTETQNFGLIPTVIGTGTTGVIGVLDNTGQTLIKIIRISTVVDEIEVMQNGQVVVLAANSLTVFDQNLDTVLWSKVLPNSGSLGNGDDYGRKISVSKDNKIVVLNAKKFTVYDAAGLEIGSSQTFTDTWISDVEIDSDNGSIFISGFNQSTSGPCAQIQLAYVRAYNYTGNFKWKAYGWSHAEAGNNSQGVPNNSANNCADSRAVKLKVSPKDGSLFLIGRSDGGNSVFRWDSHELWKDILNISMDYSNNASGLSSGSAMYIIKMNPVNGDSSVYQVHTARLSNPKGNTMKAYDIDIDNDGEIYVTGAAAYQIQDRPLQTVDGQTIGVYSGADGYVMQISEDFTKKRFLTAFSGANCPNESNSIATYNGSIVAGGFFDQKAATICNGMMYNNAIQTGFQGQTDAYFAVFGDTTIAPCTNDAINPPTCNVCQPWQTLTDGICKYSPVAQKPTVSFSVPANNQTFVIGESIPFKLNIQDPENRNQKSNIYSNLLGNIQQSSPGANGLYDYPWNPSVLTYQPAQTIGQHKITAVLIDDDGFRVVSDELIINIVARSIQNSSSSQQSSSSSNSSTQSSNSIVSSQSNIILSSSSQNQSSNQIFSSSIESISSSNSSSQNVISSSMASSISSLVSSNSSSTIVNSNFSGGTITITQPNIRNSYQVKLSGDQDVRIELINQSCPKLDEIKELKTANQSYIQFTANCDKTELKTYWPNLDPNLTYQFQKYNPITKTVIDNVPAQIITENVNGKKTVVSIHNIIDNQNGDSDPTIGRILDPFVIIPKKSEVTAAKENSQQPLANSSTASTTIKKEDSTSEEIPEFSLVRTGGSSSIFEFTQPLIFILISIMALVKNESDEVKKS
jgi:hypothetical protein